ncbi:hypothetical protein [Streptomyces sp. NPDC008122]|uniref:hypothetical protein n=1 Tax=Streptomyces sp. NPDC008122 TaxID=3364810 RepID=UPI0036EDDC4C
MPVRNMEFACSKCGEVSTYAVQTNDGAAEQSGLASHLNPWNLQRFEVPCKNSSSRDAYGPLIPQDIVVHYTQGKYEGVVGHFQSAVHGIPIEVPIAPDERDPRRSARRCDQRTR